MHSGNVPNPALLEAFTNFAKFGDSRADGKSITLTNADKWLKQADIIDGKKITTTDTGIIFNKMKSRTLSYPQFVKYIDELAKFKKVSSDEMKIKLTACGFPGYAERTQPAGQDDSRQDMAGYAVDDSGLVSDVPNTNTWMGEDL